MNATAIRTARVRAATRPTVHDISVSLKSTLVDDAGTPYRDFRRELKPRWARVWAELIVAYIVLGAVLAGLVAWDPSGGAAVVGAALGALVIGYSIAYISNFLHESAHQNLLPHRPANDFVTNLLMSWLFGSSIAFYRKVHFQHHRALGTTMDSETSYFDPLRVRLLLGGLVGLRLLQTLRRWGEVLTERPASCDNPASGDARRLLWLVVAGAVNGAIVVSLVLGGWWAATAAWVAGELAVFPFFTSLRQTLEHRAEDADARVDYRKVDHGAVNRLFGDGPVASTLGSAGFNRHALHHWEPQVSYTRLKDLERYLSRTELTDEIEARQTTYRQTFLRLLKL